MNAKQLLRRLILTLLVIPFSLTGYTQDPAIYVYYPYEGMSYYPGTEIYISWYSQDIDTFNVEFSHDSGSTWLAVSDNFQGTETYYTAPDVISDQCLIRISDSQDPTQSAVSPNFSIVELPVAAITSPNGGEVWEYNTYETVEWTGTNLPYYLLAEVSIDGGTTWNYVGYLYGEPAGGSSSIPVPYIDSDNALLRLLEPTYNIELDRSDAPFTIDVPPVIVYYPYEGQQMYQGSIQSVSWTSVPGIEFVNIDLSIDNGLTWTPVVQNEIAANSYYYWNVISEPSEDCFIRISNASDPTQFGLSPRFTILRTPVITLNYPSSGDLLNTNSNYLITWSYDIPSESQYVTLMYSIDGGQVWNYIGYGTTEGTSGSYEWTTPVVESEQCMILVSDYYMYYVSDTSEMFSILTFPQSPICMVSVDSATNRNVIVWVRPVTDMIDSFIVYKESSQANIYEEIGTVNYEDLTVFTDINSNPAVKPYRYKLGYVDALGRTFPMSDHHQTIHLSINQGVGNSWNLIWTGYQGFDVASYNIYRGADNASMEMLTTISASFQSYTDINPPSGTLYYMVEVVNPNGCDPEGRSGNYSSTFSNKASNQFASVDEMAWKEGIRIYPNPATDHIFVDMNSVGDNDPKIAITDLSGRTIMAQENIDKTGTVRINTSEFAPGVYFIKIISGDLTDTRKFIVRR